MKKTLITLCTVAAALFSMPQDADAQFFKKLKEAATNTVKQAITGDEGDQSRTDGTAGTGAEFITSASGVSVSNPAAQYFALEFVEAIGNSAGNTVTIYMKATAKDLNFSNARLGDNTVTAYDADGNEYKSNNYAKAKNMMAGVPVKFALSELPNVPARVDRLAVVSFAWNLPNTGGSKAGNLATYIQLKNVPIKWQ